MTHRKGGVIPVLGASLALYLVILGASTPDTAGVAGRGAATAKLKVAPTILDPWFALRKLWPTTCLGLTTVVLR